MFRDGRIAALNSNHIRGTAIDVTITWKGALELDQAGTPPRQDRDASACRPDRELHEIGATVFGVRKLASDPPP